MQGQEETSRVAFLEVTSRHACKTDLTTLYLNHRQRTSAYTDTKPNLFQSTNSLDKHLEVCCGFNNYFKIFFVFRKQCIREAVSEMQTLAGSQPKEAEV